jgi:hypothetical protein
MIRAPSRFQGGIALGFAQAFAATRRLTKKSWQRKAFGASALVPRSVDARERNPMTKILLLSAAGLLLLGPAACDPYNPADRALGGAAVDAGAGVGATTGVLTTPVYPYPPPPPPRY